MVQWVASRCSLFPSLGRYKKFYEIFSFSCVFVNPPIPQHFKTSKQSQKKLDMGLALINQYAEYLDVSK